MTDAHSHLLKVLEMKGFRLLGPVGKGGSSSCYAVQSLKYKDLFVCKQLVISSKTTCSQCEIDSLKRLNSANVISMYDFHVERPYVYVILEYCPNGTLMDYVMKCGPPSGRQLLGVMKTLLGAVNFIHTHRVAHLDIKPTNVLLDRYGRAKLADFGISRFVARDDTSDQHAGTTAFMAPELFAPGRFDPFKADIWALGITFFFMITGCAPWAARTLEELREMIPQGIGTAAVLLPAQVRQLVMSMCKLDPSRRPTAKELLDNPIFQNVEVKDGLLHKRLQRAESNRESKMPLTMASVAKETIFRSPGRRVSLSESQPIGIQQFGLVLE